MSRILDNKYFIPIFLLVFGFVTRFAFIWHPSQVVFDEVHFGKFASAYLTGNYFFDIHPPLGKLLIFISSYILGFNTVLDFEAIGGQYADTSFIVLRLIPNLFGALLPLCIFFFVRSINGSKIAAFFAGFTIVFENATLVQSHFIFLDSMLLFFGFMGISLFFWYRNHSKKLIYLFAAGIFLALGVSIKWTGLSFFALVWLVSLFDIIRILTAKVGLSKEILMRVIMLFVVPYYIYMLIFAVHFSLLQQSGPGDVFMSPAFTKTLQGSSVEHDDSIEPLNFFDKYAELNVRMFAANASLTATHPYSSKFYTWPLMVRPIYYWVNEDSPGIFSRIYLLGNPFIWWIAFASMVAASILWRPASFDKKLILYIGWFIAYFPFFFIKRPLFLYHYLTSLIFSIVIMSFFFFDSFDNYKKYRLFLMLFLMGLIILGFIFFMPITYGFPLNSDQFNLRIWLKSWEG